MPPHPPPPALSPPHLSIEFVDRGHEVERDLRLGQKPCPRAHVRDVVRHEGGRAGVLHLDRDQAVGRGGGGARGGGRERGGGGGGVGGSRRRLQLFHAGGGGRGGRRESWKKRGWWGGRGRVSGGVGVNGWAVGAPVRGRRCGRPQVGARAWSPRRAATGRGPARGRRGGRQRPADARARSPQPAVDRATLPAPHPPPAIPHRIQRRTGLSRHRANPPTTVLLDAAPRSRALCTCATDADPSGLSKSIH